MTSPSPTNGLVPRRRVLGYGLGGAAALGMSPLLSACGGGGTSSGASADQTVVNWMPDSRPDALASSKWWLESFEDANPGVKATLVNVPYGDDTTKLTAGHATGEVPDLIWSYGDFLYTYGVDGLVSPVSGLVDEVGRDEFLPATINGIEVDNEIYSVPFVGFPFFVYYRKDLYEEKGLRVPETHEEMLYNIKALHDAPDVFGYMLTNQAISDTWNLKCAMWTHGAYYFDEAGELALDRSETRDAWQFFTDLGKYTAPGSMSQSDLQAREFFVDGKAGHMCTTTSLTAEFKEDDLDRFGAFMWPSVPGARGASLDFYGLCVPTKAKNPGLAEDQIAFILEPENFQEYLTRTVVGWVPMLASGYSDEYLSSPKIAPIREFIELGQEVSKNGVVGTGYFGPTEASAALVSTNVEKEIGDRLVIKGESIDEVMDFAVSKIEQAL